MCKIYIRVNPKIIPWDTPAEIFLRGETKSFDLINFLDDVTWVTSFPCFGIIAVRSNELKINSLALKPGLGKLVIIVVLIASGPTDFPALRLIIAVSREES